MKIKYFGNLEFPRKKSKVLYLLLHLLLRFVEVDSSSSDEDNLWLPLLGLLRRRRGGSFRRLNRGGSEGGRGSRRRLLLLLLSHVLGGGGGGGGRGGAVDDDVLLPGGLAGCRFRRLRRKRNSRRADNVHVGLAGSSGLLDVVAPVEERKC